MQGFQVMFVDGFVGQTGVFGNRAGERQVGVAPFLGDVTPLLVCLSSVSCAYEGWMLG